MLLRCFTKGFVANQTTEQTMIFSPIGTNTNNYPLAEKYHDISIGSLVFALCSKNIF